MGTRLADQSAVGCDKSAPTVCVWIIYIITRFTLIVSTASKPSRGHFNLHVTMMGNQVMMTGIHTVYFVNVHYGPLRFPFLVLRDSLHRYSGWVGCRVRPGRSGWLPVGRCLRLPVRLPGPESRVVNH